MPDRLRTGGTFYIAPRIHMPTPLCFVLIAAGEEHADAHAFDAERIYAELLAPAARAAGLQPILPEHGNGVQGNDSPTFEQLVLCEYALVDVTSADANAIYKLGTRHAFRPRNTVLTFAEDRSRVWFAPQVNATSGFPRR